MTGTYNNSNFSLVPGCLGLTFLAEVAKVTGTYNNSKFSLVPVALV